jgi:hypothetical protein
MVNRKYLTGLLSLVFLLTTGIAFSQLKSPSANFRIFPSTTTQTEPVVCFSPLNKQIMFASAYTINTSSAFRSEGVYVSTNGGYNWYGTDTCKGVNLQNHGGDPGVSIDKNGAFIITHIGSIITGVYSHYSTDMGSTWSNAYTLTSLQPEDKGSSTTDDSPSSPYYGRTYACWVNFVSPFPVLVSYSTNSGANWTSPAQINPSPQQRCSGGYIKTGLNGYVFSSWSGVSSTSPFTENIAGFAVSTNGGANWTVYQNVYPMNGINGTLLTKGNIRVNGLPRFDIDKTNGPRNGLIYMITAEKNLSPAGSDPDIIMHRSTNNGLNWSAGIRVNQDALNNGKIQYCPAIDVDSTGAVNVIYYDDRNTSSDSAEVMLSRSKDGGNTWTDIVISDHRFKPKPITGGAASYQGDFISLVSTGNKLYAHWMDDFSGIYQIWSTIIDLSTIGITKISSEIPTAYKLEQNYPNPFNPETRIKYSVPKNTDLSIKLYDLQGRELGTLAKGFHTAGVYELNFNTNEFGFTLPSGVYFYKLISENFTVSKKMLLTK